LLGCLSKETFQPAFFTYSSLLKISLTGKQNLEIVAVFNTNAGHPLLNDDRYNLDRGIKTGNPYKNLIIDLMKQGVQIEMCGATAAGHNWGNSDFIPGVKVNTDAMARIAQLAEEGFIVMTEW
jgi:intracellular sulfur oxidation DsrE/DsrF family protein